MDKHEKTKMILKICGGILLAVGIILALIGFIDFFGSIKSGTGMPDKFWCLILGLPLTGCGGMLLSIGFKREFMNYNKNESVPVINDASKDLQPAFKNIAEAVTRGSDEKSKTCSCGAINDENAKFCKSCGKKLTLTCPFCGDELAPDSKYCDNCGAKL